MTAKRPLLPIFLIVLVDVFGFTLVIPLLAIYAERYGATPFVATLLVSSYAACQLVSGPLLGRISDRVGRKPMLLISQIGTLLGFLLLANATTLWVIFAARIIDGATAGNLSLAQAYISDNTAKENRAKAFGMIGIAFGVGFFLGPTLTGWLVGFGLTVPIYAAALLSFTSILCTTFLLPGGRPPQNENAASAGHLAKRPLLQFRLTVDDASRPRLRGLLAQFFAFTFSFATFISGFALFSERRFRWHEVPFGPQQIGYVFAYSGFLGIILQGAFFGRLVRRFGEARLAWIGFLSMMLSFTGFGLAHSIGGLVLATSLTPFGNAFIRPTLTSLITQTAGRHEQGAVLGLSQSLQALGQILAPPVAGYLIGRGLLGAWAGVAVAAAAVGLLLAPLGSGRRLEVQTVPPGRSPSP